MYNDDNTLSDVIQYDVELMILYGTNKVFESTSVENRTGDSLAQLVEHWIPDPKVVGSSPARVTHRFDSDS